MDDGYLDIRRANFRRNRAVEVYSQCAVRGGALYTVFNLVIVRKHLLANYCADPLNNFKATLVQFFGANHFYFTISQSEIISKNSDTMKK